jgi:alpha-D-xyloside xylohydrolase
VDDEFMLGPDLLVAPILSAGLRERPVYLPPGLWKNAWTGVECAGGTTISVDAPLDRIPVLLRSSAHVPVAG